MDFGNKSPLKKYVRDLGCAPYLSFLRSCLIWENLVGYGFLVLLVIVDYAYEFFFIFLVLNST